jgi:hypothetical protein
MTAQGSRAPAARNRLEQAKLLLTELSEQAAIIALEASEGKAGAEKALAAHRSKIELAERNVSEMQRAATLAERLDREAAATAVIGMRDEQMTDFAAHMRARGKAMADVMATVVAMQKAYTSFCEATQAAEAAVPSGTSIPVMQTWPNGVGGHSFGKQEQLILGEFWRIAPLRDDGSVRFALPFAKCPLVNGMNPHHLTPAIDAFREADQVIVARIEEQVRTLNNAAMSGATGDKEAA